MKRVIWLCLVLAAPAAGQGFPFPTKTARPRTPTPLPVASATPTATPPAIQPTPTFTATATPVPSSGPDCLAAWPTPTGVKIRMDYRWTGFGACFYLVSDEQMPDADVFLRVNRGSPRQLRWQPNNACWTYADDGTVPYAFPRVGLPPVLFAFEFRKGGVTHLSSGVRFFPPSYVPVNQL